MKTNYLVVGVMAGSSMDGLDIVKSHFVKENNSWKYKVVDGFVQPYDLDLYQQLKSAGSQSRKQQEKLDKDFGLWIGQSVLQGGIDHVDLVAIHGHTLIHDPKNGISWQLGNGKHISNHIGKPVVVNFRTLDIEKGGQGAPLVPKGDFELFNTYDACINLGGIANISIKKNKSAWDICPCNQILNYYANRLGFSYDHDGNLAKGGVVNEQFISSLNEIKYFSNPNPKSLPNLFIPATLLEAINPTDSLRSYTEFIATQISRDIQNILPGKMLITGGGAFNSFLLERLNYHLKGWKLIIPDKTLITFKEAIIFAFLGLLRYRNEINVLASVTGANTDSSSGEIYVPQPSRGSSN